MNNHKKTINEKSFSFSEKNYIFSPENENNVDKVLVNISSAFLLKHLKKIKSYRNIQ